MFKGLVIFLFLFLVPPILYSQISGRVVDSNSKEPMYGATIQGFSSEGEMLEGAMSDADGRFILINNSIIKLHITFLGFEDKILEDKDGTLKEDLGDISLHENPIMIGEVMVVGSLRKQNADTETIFISDSIRKGSVSASQMLNKIHGIQTDWISETIKVGNDNNVPVIVNGNEVTTSYAMSINPKRIKKIEIIRHPVGRFSDYPVIINLELYQDYIGWDISPRIIGMISLLNKHSNREVVGVDLNWTVNKWNTYFSTEYDRKKMYNASSYVKNYGEDYLEESLKIDIENPNNMNKSNVYKISFGLEYNINKNHSMSTQFWNNVNWVDIQEDFKASIQESQNSILNNILTQNQYKSPNTAMGLFYRGTFDDKLQLTSDMLYNTYRIDEYRLYSENKYFSEKNSKGVKDYLRYNIAGRYLLSSTWNIQIDNSMIWRKYTSFSEPKTFDYESSEFRDRLNTTLDFHPSQNFNIKAGSGLLFVKSTANLDNQQTISLLPYFKLFWKPFRNLQINTSFYNSVDYPNLDQLSTLVWQVDKFLVHQGNGNLRARVMNYAEIQLRLKNNLKITYMKKYSKNEISLFYKPYNNNTFLETLSNSNYNHSYVGIDFDYKTKSNIFFNFLTNYQWYNLYMTYNDKNKGNTFTIDTRVMYNIPYIKTNLLASLYLRSDRLPLLQGKEYNQEELFGVGINKSFINDKLPVTLMIALPTQFIQKETYKKINIPGMNIIRYEDARVNSFMLSLNIRYNISNNKARKFSKELILDQEK